MMTADTGPRQLFTQASNPNAPPPLASPYSSPPATPMLGASPGAYGSPPPGAHSGGHAHDASGSGGYAHGGAYVPTQYGGPGAEHPVSPLPPPAFAPAPSPQIQGPTSPGGFVPNKKAAYQPQAPPAAPQQPPQHVGGFVVPGSPPPAVEGAGPMAYHQIMQGGQTKEAPAPMQAPPAPAPVMHQPGPTAPMGMAVDTSGGGQKDERYDAKGEREWTHGLFDCCADAGTCASFP